MDDHQLAAALAEDAGRLLLALRQSASVAGAVLGLIGDAVSNTFITAALADRRPLDALLSEESIDNPARLSAERVWIVDPLDGTREYACGRDDWAVHVALAQRGAPVAGAVAVPAAGQVFATGTARPARPRRARPVMVVSRTRPPAGAEALAAALGAELRTMGSAGAKAMAVVAGEADLYFHSGGQHEWDNCAPVAVALAAGLHASRANGTPIRYNQADTRVPDLVIAEPAIGRAALDILAGRSG